MKKKMEDIARAVGGIRTRGSSQVSESSKHTEYDSHSSKPLEETFLHNEDKEDPVETPWSEAPSSEEGVLHRSLRPLDERDQRRAKNPFLQKLRDKRGVIHGHISHGGEFKRPTRKLWKYVLGIFILIFLVIYAFFPSVAVEVTPRTETVTFLSNAYTATYDDSGVLSYETVTITKSVLGSAKATAVKEVEERASGKLTVYNTYSAEPLTLIDNTRFESPEGKIYRIQESVTVPGMEGGNPGIVTVMVHADEPGKAYNFTKTGAKFTIPGLSGIPAYYDAFYAKTAAALDGGYSGISKVVPPDELEQVEKSLSADLHAKLLKQARADLSEKFILFDGATQVTFDTDVQNRANLEEGTAKVEVTGTLKGIVFNKSELTQTIAKNELAKYNGGEVSVEDWSTVSFSFKEETAEGNATSTSKMNFNDPGVVTFELGGNAALLWAVPKEEIAQALAGKKKSEFDEVLSSFGYQVSTAETTMRPFWNNTFPKESGEIKIEVKKTKVP